MNIAIVDDEKNIRRYLRKLIEKQDKDCVILEYASGRELIFDIMKLREKNNGCIKSDTGADMINSREMSGAGFDIIFLDIAMENTDGMKTAEALRQIQAENGVSAWGSLPLIIFVTGLDSYMQKAFSVCAFRYMLKPIDENEFEKLFHEAMLEVQKIRNREEKADRRITVGSGIDTHVIRVCDIVYIESSGHKNLIHLEHARHEYYGNLIDLEHELSPDFFRIHRGFLINIMRVDHYNRHDVFMDNGDCIPISRYKFQEFVKAYLEYIKE